MNTLQDEITDSIISAIPTEKDILERIASKYYPEDVFSKEELDKWAEENGYSLSE